MNTEVNGPANIIMLIDQLYENNQLDKASYDIIRKNAENTVAYLRLLSNPNNIKWADIIKR